MLLAAARALAGMGAHVVIAQGGENLIRRLLPPAAPTPDRGSGADAPTIAEVRAEGLPNLLHELVHAVQAGRLDDDHGIDYAEIPFDLDAPAGRAVLWDELSCCVVSCAYLWRHGRSAREGAPPPAVRAEVDAWFREQVEIQPVFYGMEQQPDAFVARVGAVLDAFAEEADDVLRRAYAATERALQDAGAEPVVAMAPRRPSMRSLWPLLTQEPLEVCA